MREIFLKFQFLLRLIHVDSSRLIFCGVDGISSSYLKLENLDKEIYLHLPVYLDPISHSPTILTWIQSWISNSFNYPNPVIGFIDISR